jgi:hypothetical protein
MNDLKSDVKELKYDNERDKYKIKKAAIENGFLISQLERQDISTLKLNQHSHTLIELRKVGKVTSNELIQIHFQDTNICSVGMHSIGSSDYLIILKESN